MEMECASDLMVLGNKGPQDGNELNESLRQKLANIDWDGPGYRESMTIFLEVLAPEPAAGTAAEFPGQAGIPIPGFGYAVCQVCQEPESLGETLLCDGCRTSFHITCLRLQAEHACKLDEWFCQSCSERGFNESWPLGMVDLNFMLSRSSLEGGRKGCKNVQQGGPSETADLSNITVEEATFKSGDAGILQVEGRGLNGGRGSQTDNFNSPRPRASSQLSSDGSDNNSLASCQNKNERKRSRQETETTSKSFSEPDVPVVHRDVEQDGTHVDQSVDQLQDGSRVSCSPERLLKCADEALEQLRIYIASRNGTLDDGWTAHVRERRREGRAPTTRTHYYSPEKKLFYSRKQVARHLGLVDSEDDAGSASVCEAETQVMQTKCDGSALSGHAVERLANAVTGSDDTVPCCQSAAPFGALQPPTAMMPYDGGKADASLTTCRRSKPARAANTGVPGKATTDAAELEQQERFRRLEVAAVEQLRRYVADRNGTLEDGWAADVTKRKKGKGSTVRTHYVSPMGKVFKSRVQVVEYLGLPKNVPNSQEIVAAGYRTTVTDVVNAAANVGEVIVLSGVVDVELPVQVPKVPEESSRVWRPTKLLEAVSAMDPSQPREAESLPSQVQIPMMIEPLSQPDLLFQTHASRSSSGKGYLQLLEENIVGMRDRSGRPGGGWNQDECGLVTNSEYGVEESRCMLSRIDTAHNSVVVEPFMERVREEQWKGIPNSNCHDSAEGAPKDEREESECSKCQEDAGDALTEDDLLRNIREFVAEQNVLLEKEMDLQMENTSNSFAPRKRARVRSCLDIARQLGASGLKNLDVQSPDTGV